MMSAQPTSCGNGPGLVGRLGLGAAGVDGAIAADGLADWAADGGEPVSVAVGWLVQAATTVASSQTAIPEARLTL
jgi:hypothetical protein